MERKRYHSASKGRVVLAATGYFVRYQDGQVIFEEEGPVYSTHTQFAFEKTIEINNTPGIWYFVHLDSSSGRVPASHLVAAMDYCNDFYGKNFEPIPEGGGG